MSLELLAVVGMIAGLIVLLVGHVLLIIAGFRESLGWGLACLLLGLGGSLVFAAMHFRQTRVLLAIEAFGALLMLGSVQFLGASPSAVERVVDQGPRTFDRGGPVAPRRPDDREATLLSPRGTASRGAFDLVPHGAGALLLWGEPDSLGGVLRGARLDARGMPVASPFVLDTPHDGFGEALEVAADSTTSEVGVAWVVREESRLAVLGTTLDAATLEVEPRTVLARTDVLRAARRGNVVVAAEDGGPLHAFHRARTGPCTTVFGARATACARFEDHVLGTPRPRVSFGIESACDAPLVSVLVSATGFHAALCARRGDAPTVAWFDGHAASEVLPGCEGLGTATLDDGAILLVARCDGAPRGIRYAAGAASDVDLSGAQARCESGAAVLDLAPGVSVRLTGPRGALAPLLPASLAPPGSRAVWTGTALLVAAPLDREVALRRYECEQTALLRSDL